MKLRMLTSLLVYSLFRNLRRSAFALLPLLFISAGCIKKADPTLGDLASKFSSPTSLTGESPWTVTVTQLTVPVTVDGICDQRTLYLEIMGQGDSAFKKILGDPNIDASSDLDCKDGRFRIITISDLSFMGFTAGTSGSRTFYIRQITRLGPSSSSLLTVAYSPSAATGALLTISGAGTFDFGNLPLGASTSTTFTISNTGINGATAILGTGFSGPFAFLGGSFPGTGGTCTTTLAISATCTIVVVFSPSGTGLFSNTFTISYNDGTTSQNTSKTIQGTGQTLASLSINNGPTYDFGSWPTAGSTAVTFTVTNSGQSTASSMSGSGLSAPFTFKGGSFPGTGGTCTTSLTGGSTCDVVVLFSPVSLVSYSSTLQIDYVNGVSAALTTRAVQGSGANAANLSISDGPTFDYGSVGVGSSQDKTFTITNIGGSSATFLGDGGGLSAPFAFKGGSYPGTGGNCTSTLAASGTCTVIVTMTPSAGGSASSTLVLSYFTGVGGTSSSRPVQGLGVLNLTVAPVYPINGLNWNDYVKNDGSDIYHGTDTACVGNEAGITGCAHGGELKKVSVTGYSTCTNLTLTDSLGIFRWKCVVEAGPTATFFTYGFMPGKGLRNLLNSTSWKSNSVTVQLSAVTIGTSPSTAWWTNAVYPLPTGSVSVKTLDTSLGYPSSTVFTLASASSSYGFNINMDKASLVTLASAALNWVGSSSPNSCSTTGESSSPTQLCNVAVGSQKFVWIEADIGLSSAPATPQKELFLYGAIFTRVHNTRIWNSVGSGLEITNSKNNRITKLSSMNNMTSSGNGILLSNASSSIFSDIHTSNNGVGTATWLGRGISVTANSSNNIFQNILTSANGDAGFGFVNSSGNIVTATTANNNHWNGIYFDIGAGSNVIHNLSVVNSQATIEGGVVGVTTNYLSHLALNGSNTTQMIKNQTSNVFEIEGVVKVPSGSTCSISGSGITVACGATGPSSYSKVLGTLGGSTFIGKITSTDSQNLTNTSGTNTFALSNDWVNFSNWYRDWGFDGAAFPSSGNEGPCTTGTCRIWDWNLSVSDTIILNRSGNGSTVNSAFTNGGACPAEVGGNIVANQGGLIFLMNAVEVLNDGIGNENGLCENNEDCIYTPNFGAYQGHGDFYTQSCTFSNGTVSNVKMYAYPVNGY